MMIYKYVTNTLTSECRFFQISNIMSDPEKSVCFYRRLELSIAVERLERFERLGF